MVRVDGCALCGAACNPGWAYPARLCPVCGRAWDESEREREAIERVAIERARQEAECEQSMAVGGRAVMAGGTESSNDLTESALEGPCQCLNAQRERTHSTESGDGGSIMSRLWLVETEDGCWFELRRRPHCCVLRDWARMERESAERAMMEQ